MVRLSIALLGGFRAELGPTHPVAIPSRKAQALLAYLALESRQSASRAALAALLWPANADDQARHNLRQALFALRRALGGPRAPLTLDGETIALTAGAVDVDVARFEHCVAAGTPAALDEATALYRGDLLDGFTLRQPAFDDWLALERARLRELAATALRRQLAGQATTSATERAIQTGLRLLSLDPLDEHAHRTHPAPNA